MELEQLVQRINIAIKDYEPTHDAAEITEIYSIIKKPQSHLVFLNCPTSSQLNPMLDLAKLLHLNGFYITFVITESCRNQILDSAGSDALKGKDSFRFETISDGSLSESNKHVDGQRVVLTLGENCAVPFDKLIQRLNSSLDVPPITCIIADLLMIFGYDVAEKHGLPFVVYWTASACGLLGALQLPELVRRGYTPLKDKSYLTNGYLDTKVEWIQGMENIRLKDLYSFIRATNPDDPMLKFALQRVNCYRKASAVILNTFESMESESLEVIKSFIPQTYTIGPLATLLNSFENSQNNSLQLSLRKLHTDACIQWLNKQKPSSVLYASFGSLTTITTEQLTEFAWGLARSNHPFLWIIRADNLRDGSAALPEDFIVETEGRGFIANWCNQAEVLAHSSVGCFLTHGGWNSMLESIGSGVPMVFWPGFAEQYTNCCYACEKWGVGLEIEHEVKREHVTEIVREAMGGKGREEMKRNVMRLKVAAEEACREEGSSCEELMGLIKDLSA